MLLVVPFLPPTATTVESISTSTINTTDATTTNNSESSSGGEGRRGGRTGAGLEVGNDKCIWRERGVSDGVLRERARCRSLFSGGIPSTVGGGRPGEEAMGAFDSSVGVSGKRGVCFFRRGNGVVCFAFLSCVFFCVSYLIESAVNHATTNQGSLKVYGQGGGGSLIFLFSESNTQDLTLYNSGIQVVHASCAQW